MTQTANERRLWRVAYRMNRRAQNAKVPGRISAEDLAYVIINSNDSCHYCGIGLDRSGGSFDHAIPLDKGGANDTTNIVRSCVTCNRTKFTKSPNQMRQYDSLTVNCRVCGKAFKPRWAEWANGRARTCSRSCAAKTRWMRKPFTAPENANAQGMDARGSGASTPNPYGGHGEAR